MTLSIPGYQSGQLLGYGSHGEVWSAVSRRTGEHVAVKRVELTSDAAVTAIRGEAALLAALSHPNIIGLREFVEADDCAMLVMELAAGGSLTDLMARRGRLTDAEVGVCFSDLAAALAYAHDEGVLHGDVSAGNVLFTADGRAKLADLGLARVLGESALGMGTPTYVDPVVAGGGAAGAASDVFSLAAVALHALTGDGPWKAAQGRSREAVLSVAVTAEIADLHDRLSGCPADLAAALVRALDPQPARRGTAAELALDLRAAVMPTAVTVQAGKLGPAAGRHYARRDTPADRDTAAPAATSYDRPAFLRPDAQVGASADLTHASRSEIRALLAPPPAPRRWWSRGVSGWRATALIGAAAAACGLVIVFISGAGDGVAATLLGHDTHGSGAGGSGVPSGVAAPRTPTPTVLPGTGALAGKASATAAATSAARTGSAAGAALPSAAGSAAGSALPSAAEVAGQLRVIDARRAAAFATGRADLLADVYDSPELLAEDTAQLRRVVGPGCSLTPLTTDYRDVVVSPLGQGGVNLTAMVSTSAAELNCHGAASGHVEATAAAPMTITLTRQPGGVYRIASQRPAGR